MGPADVPAFNKAVFAALKPGGVYVVLDHAAAAADEAAPLRVLHDRGPARRCRFDGSAGQVLVIAVE